MSENKKDKSNIINELSKNILFNDTCEIITNNEFEIPKTKSEGLLLWIKFSHVVYDENKIEELYSHYKEFLTTKFDEELPKSVLYSKPNKHFKKSLEKMFVFKF